MTRATVISWDRVAGGFVLGAGPHATALPFHPDNPDKNAETLARMARYLMHIAEKDYPLLPLPPIEAESGVPYPTPEEIARLANRYLHPGAAKGVKPPSKKIGREKMLDMLSRMEEDEELVI